MSAKKWASAGLVAAGLLGAAVPCGAQSAGPTATITISAGDLFKNRVEIAAGSDAANKDLVLFSLTDSVKDRLANGCRLAADAAGKVTIQESSSPKCAELLTRYDGSTMALSEADSLKYKAIVFPKLKDYDGASGKLLATFEKKDPKSLTWDGTAVSEKPIALAPGGSCFLKRTSSWQLLPCTAVPATNDASTASLKVTFEAPYKQIVEAALIASTSVTLAAKVLDSSSAAAGDYRLLSVQRKPEDPPADTSTNDAPAAPPPFAEDCLVRAQRLLGAQAAPSPARPEPPDPDPIYAVCADFFQPSSPTFSVYEVTRGVEPGAASPDLAGYKAVSANLLRTRRAIHVFVRYPPANKVEVTVDGTAGMASSVSDPHGFSGRTPESPLGPKGAAEPTPPKPPPPSVAHFPELPRLAGTLTVKIKVLEVKGDATKEVTSRDYKLLVENYVKVALRLGLGVTWQPWSRLIEERAGGDNLRYTTVAGGDGNISGVFGTELMIGVSYFLFKELPVSDARFETALGLGAWLGLARMQENGLEGLTSLMVGPELALGPDFSIALLGGIHRNYIPKRGFEPGSVLPAGQTYEANGRQLSFTPGFGLALSFTPSIFRTFFVKGDAK